MRKALGIVISIGLLSMFGSSQTIIENSAKPLYENPGRILELEELMRITDEGEKFYFKRPFRLSLDADGFIYFQDDEFFLKFSPDGEFIRNLAHIGQGPGETQSCSYDIQGDTINVWDTRGKKVVLYDLDGQFIREFRPAQHPSQRMIGHYQDSLIFSTYDMPKQGAPTGMVEIHHRIFLVSRNTGEETEIGAFPLPWYITSSSGAGYAPFRVLPNEDGSLLYVNDSPEYRIKIMDTSTWEILRVFSRKYRHVKAPKRPPRPGDTRPERKYLYDITYMMRNLDQVWIWNSTTEENKGANLDVFSPQGEYLDCFFLPEEISFMYVEGDILFARNQDEDGIYSVVKYRILNGPSIQEK